MRNFRKTLLIIDIIAYSTKSDNYLRFTTLLLNETYAQLKRSMAFSKFYKNSYVYRSNYRHTLIVKENHRVILSSLIKKFYDFPHTL